MTDSHPLWIFVALLIISMVSIWLHGYEFSSGDQALYVPFVQQKVNPHLYPHDLLQNMPENKLSLFFPLMARLIDITRVDVEQLYISLYTLFHYAALIAMFFLAYSLTQHRSSALIATFLFAIPKYVGGTAITTLDISLLPRFISLPIFIVGMDAIFKKKYKKATLIIDILLLLHPFSAINLGIFYAGIIIAKNQFRRALTAFPYLLPGLMYVFWLRTSMPMIANPGYIEEAWWVILSSRISYNFLQLWKISGWVSSGLILAIISIYGQVKRNHKLAQSAHIVLFTSFVVTIIHIFAVEIIKFTSITQLQLLRIWIIPTIISIIAVSDLIARKKIAGLVGVIALLTITSPLKVNAIELPHSRRGDWVDVQKWIKRNTPLDTIVLTPPHRVGFRVFSERSIVGEIKDGSSGLYSYNFAQAWQERISDIHPLWAKSTAEIRALQSKYAFDYLVTFTSHPYNALKELHRNETFVVYKL